MIATKRRLPVAVDSISWSTGKIISRSDRIVSIFAFDGDCPSWRENRLMILRINRLEIQPAKDGSDCQIVSIGQMHNRRRRHDWVQTGVEKRMDCTRAGGLGSLCC